MKTTLCQWLEDNWDHKMLIWVEDTLATMGLPSPMSESIVRVPFNPTAENMAEYLVTEIGPTVLGDSGIVLVKVVVEETRKCFASFSLEDQA